MPNCLPPRAEVLCHIFLQIAALLCLLIQKTLSSECHLHDNTQQNLCLHNSPGDVKPTCNYKRTDSIIPYLHDISFDMISGGLTIQRRNVTPNRSHSPGSKLIKFSFLLNPELFQFFPRISNDSSANLVLNASQFGRLIWHQKFI